MREIQVILSGVQWQAGIMLLLNPADEAKQGWFHQNLVEGGAEVIKGYSKGRKLIKITVDERVAQDLEI